MATPHVSEEEKRANDAKLAHADEWQHLQDEMVKDTVSALGKYI